MRAHRATTPGVPNFLHGYEDRPFARYVQVLAEQAAGVNMPMASCPRRSCSRSTGRASSAACRSATRSRDVLLRLGGHIGYAVVPEFRRRGYATEMLRRAVRIAGHELGLERGAADL